MRSGRTRAVTTLIAITALAVSACAGAATTPSTQPSQTSLPTAVVPSAIAATPTAQPSPSSLAVLPDSGTFGPGTYATHFQPPLTFTLADLTVVAADGTIVFDSVGEVDVHLPAWIGFEFGFNEAGNWAADVMIIRLDKVFDPEHPGTLLDPPTNLAAWIKKLPGLTLLAPPKAVKIGGLDATQLDVQTGDKDVQFGPIPGVDDPGAGFGSGQRGRLNVVRVEGHHILIWISPINDDSRDHFDRSVQQLQPLVDSIVWH